MQYENVYRQLIEKRTKEVLENDYEVHHILPKCMGGGDEESNLVRLTFREHFLCHMWLTNIYPESMGLLYAAYMMSKRIKNSRQYHAVRKKYLSKKRLEMIELWKDPEYLEKQKFRSTEEFSKTQSERMVKLYKERPELIANMKETKKSNDYSSSYNDEWRKNISDSLKNRPKPEGFGDKVSKARLGMVLSDETKERISKSRSGKGLKDSNAMASAENRKKVSESKIGRKMVVYDGVRRYITKEEFESIKDHIEVISGKLHYDSK